MNRSNINQLTLSTATVVIISLVISFQCLAQNASNSGWKSLFNGENLNGWEWVEGKHKAEARDGMIVATEVEGVPNGFLCTTDYYTDFILELDVKTDILMENSGIQFRSKYNDEFSDNLYGYQAQIQNRTPHRSQWNGAIYDEDRMHWMYILEDDPVRQKAFVHNQWNRYRIEAIGTTIRVWVNGIPTSHLVDLERAENETPTRENDAKIGSPTTNGAICLQVHGVLSGASFDIRFGKSVYMRNVRIQTENLWPSPYDDIPVLNYKPNHISGQEAHQGFELLFDGETTDNWRVVSDSGWEIEDGVLTVLGSEEAKSGKGTRMLVTDKKYGPFELKFDFKRHSEGGIAGIKYFSDEAGEGMDAEGEALFGKMAAYQGQPAPPRNPREWNSGVIKVSPDGFVEHWVNGYKILEYQRDAKKAAWGHIVLDAYDTISYKSIKIREL